MTKHEIECLFDLQTLRSNASNTRRSESFDIEHEMGAPVDIQTLRINIIKHERDCFIWYPSITK